MVKIPLNLAIAGIKILVVLTFFWGIGSIFISWGWVELVTPPNFATTGYTIYHIIRFADHSTGIVRIEPTSGTGLVSIPYNSIKTNISVTMKEPTKNSTTIEVEFPEASISTYDKENAMENRIVKLQHNDLPEYNIDENSTYFAQPTLEYFHGGQFDVLLNITNSNTQMLEKEYGTKQNTESFILPSVISIQSSDSYQELQISQRNFGATLMILGISIVISATVFTVLIDAISNAIPDRKSKKSNIHKLINEMPVTTNIDLKNNYVSSPPDIAKERFVN